MSEHMFGVTRRRLSARECQRRDRICKDEGGTGYTQIQDATGAWLGWFTGPNLGAPFDDRRAQAVMARVEVP